MVPLFRIGDSFRLIEQLLFPNSAESRR